MHMYIHLKFVFKFCYSYKIQVCRQLYCFALHPFIWFLYVKIKHILVLCFREISNGLEKKGKKKSVGRPPGPYTRKMIQKTAEPPLVRKSIYRYKNSQRPEISKELTVFSTSFDQCFKYFFLPPQDKESVSENPTLDLPCSIG